MSGHRPSGDFFWMAARDTTYHGNGGGDRGREGAFPRYERRSRALAAGWTPVDLGGHEVVGHLFMTLRPGVEAAGEGRHALDPLEGSIDSEQLDTLRLLVTELVTNSVRHAGSPGWIGLNV